jgi:sulfate transport system permease protein
MTTKPTTTTATKPPTKPTTKPTPPTTEPAWLQRLAIAVAVAFVGVVLVVPLGAVFVFACADGVAAAVAALTTPDTLQAIGLSWRVALLVLPLNVVFGLAAAWLLSRFRFAGQGLLLTVVDVPFSVSPVVAGLLFVLVFGRAGVLGPWLLAHDVKVLFALPALVLTTLFVTLPLVCREVLPVLAAGGFAEEEAAYTLGASSWRTFFSVTLPKVRWALLYGVVLANARALGEFGAVAVVSGRIRGVTTTLPLQAEMLYEGYDAVGCFSVAALLTVFGLLALAARKFLEHRLRREQP